MEIDPNLPFELKIQGSLYGKDGKLYPGGIYPPGKLPANLLKEVYGSNVAEPDLEPLIPSPVVKPEPEPELEPLVLNPLELTPVAVASLPNLDVPAN